MGWGGGVFFWFKHFHTSPRQLNRQGALSFALQRQLSAPPTATTPLSLSMSDLRRALKEARPHFGSGGGGGGDGQAGWMRPGPGLALRAFRPEVPALLGEVMDCLGKVRAVGMGETKGGVMPPLVALLLQGPPGAGKVIYVFVDSISLRH